MLPRADTGGCGRTKTGRQQADDRAPGDSSGVTPCTTPAETPGRPVWAKIHKKKTSNARDRDS